MSQKYENNIKLNYVFTFIKNLNFTHGIWMIYLYSKGFSLLQLGMLESVFHITSFVMETPTGAIADLYGRKLSRLLGVLSFIVYLLIMYFGTSYLTLVVAFIFCGLSYNLESGANQAFVYDSLKHMKQESRNMKINGINEVLYQSASSVALFIGGILAVISMRYNFLISVVFALVAFGVLLFMKETSIQHENRVKMNLLESIMEQYRIVIHVIKNEKKIVEFILFINVLGVFVTTAFFYMQNYWKFLGFTELNIGIFLGVHSLTSAIGGFFAHRIEKKYSQKFILKILPAIVTFFLFFLFHRELSIVAMAFIGFFEAVSYVVLNDYIQRLIPSSARATVLSFSSTVFSLLMIILFPTFGLIGDHYGMVVAFNVFALTGLFTLIVYYRNLKEQLS